MATPAHEAADYSLEERVAYATVVAQMAAADDVLMRSERKQVEKLCDALALQGAEREGVLAAAKEPDPELAAKALESLRATDLRFTLFTDCLLVAMADDDVVVAEEAALERLADELGIDDVQGRALQKYAETLHATVEGRLAGDEAERRGLEVSEALKEANVPLKPLALVSAAGLGLTASTVTFAALAAAIGLSSGIGAVLGLGIGTIVGVRWLQKNVFNG